MAKTKKQSSMRITQEDFMLANRKASREEEIALHGKQVSFRKVMHRSAKQYDRKKGKAVPQGE